MGGVQTQPRQRDASAYPRESGSATRVIFIASWTPGAFNSAPSTVQAAVVKLLTMPLIFSPHILWLRYLTSSGWLWLQDQQTDNRQRHCSYRYRCPMQCSC